MTKWLDELLTDKALRNWNDPVWQKARVAAVELSSSLREPIIELVNEYNAKKPASAPDVVVGIEPGPGELILRRDPYQLAITLGESSSEVKATLSEQVSRHVEERSVRFLSLARFRELEVFMARRQADSAEAMRLDAVEDAVQFLVQDFFTLL